MEDVSPSSETLDVGADVEAAALGRDASARAPAFPRRNAATGWAYRGSQRHIQAYVNQPELTPVIDAAIMRRLPVLEGCRMEWRAPRADQSYAEPAGGRFLELVHLTHLAPKLAEFWPIGGPEWDAVAIAEADSERFIVLVEAKANVQEFQRGRRRATAEASIRTIDDSLKLAREKLGATGSAQSWVGAHYQVANRIAWTLWLREQGAAAVLAYVLFTDDRSYQPTTEAALCGSMDSALEELGISAAAIAHWTAVVPLPATT